MMCCCVHCHLFHFPLAHNQVHASGGREKSNEQQVRVRERQAGAVTSQVDKISEGISSEPQGTFQEVRTIQPNLSHLMGYLWVVSGA